MKFSIIRKRIIFDDIKILNLHETNMQVNPNETCFKFSKEVFTLICR